MSTQKGTHVPPVAMVKVASNLREIERLAKRPEPGQPDPLLTQAVAAADDPLMPGGLAMVALASSANLEAYAHKLDTAEELAAAAAFKRGLDPRDHVPEIEDDDTWEPPLQTLCFWTEQWRSELGMEFTPDDIKGPRGSLRVKRPTIASEVSFIRWALDWVWDNELHWNDFAKDLEKVRGRLEALLAEGFRPSMRGVSCLYDECRGARLIRTTVAKSKKTKDPETGEETSVRVWVLTDWHCPRCERTWNEDEYARMVQALSEAAKVPAIEEYNPDTDSFNAKVWCTPDHAAKRVGRSIETIRTWVKRGEVPTLCVVAGQREGFVRLESVVDRHELAVRRAEKRKQTIAAKRASGV